MTAADPALPAELRDDADRALWRLIESVPALLWVADASGAWTYVNRRWRQFTGGRQDEHTGDGWVDHVHPDDRAAVIDAFARARASGTAFEVQHRLITARGEHRWMLMRGAPRGDAAGVAPGYVGVLIDITEGRHAAERLRASEERLHTIVTCAPVGFALFDLEMRYVRVNQALAEINGIEADDHLGRRPSDLLPAGLGQSIAVAFRRVLDGEESVSDVEVSGSTPAHPGVERHWLTSWYPVRTDGEIVAVGVFASEITSRVRAERGIALLSDVGEALDAALGVDERLARLADLVVPALADFCTIDTLGPDGELRLVAGAHSGPGGVDLLRELRVRTAGDADNPLPVARVMRSGLAEIIELSPSALDERVAASSAGDLLRELHPRAVMVLPIAARGRVLGVLVLGTTTSGRVYDDDHLALARQLARRTGLAVDNARLYENERRIALTLRQSLLPPALPDIPGLDVGARFSPMGEGDEVGGDFYDVFLAGESWVAVIGDVCGKGAEAAALTSLARHGVRALGRDDPPPSSVLSALNDVIIGERGLEPRFSTVAYARLSGFGGGDGVSATVASAGHPLPLVVRASGAVETLGVPGTLLGPFRSVRVRDVEGRLGAGDALVLYTDGVTEARRSEEMFGEARLMELLARTAGRSADEIAGAIEDAVVAFHGGPLADDLAVLVVRVGGGAPAGSVP